jgi:hypothetical protein
MEYFKAYLEQQKLAKTTITNHIRNLSKLDIKLLEGPEKDLAKHIKANYNVGSAQKTITTSVAKYRGYKELPKTEISELLKKTNNQAFEIQKKNNDELELPDIKNVKSLMNLYLKQGMYKQYVVMYLLLHLNTRNLDLVAKVTDNIDDVNNDDNWLYLRKSDVVFFRNNYKTKAKFGMKKDIIKSKRFHFSVSQLKELLRPNENLYRTVMKITGQINETTMMKLSLCNNNTAKGIKKLSKNRGTAISTVVNNYDCTKSN